MPFAYFEAAVFSILQVFNHTPASIVPLASASLLVAKVQHLAWARKRFACVAQCD